MFRGWGVYQHFKGKKNIYLFIPAFGIVEIISGPSNQPTLLFITYNTEFTDIPEKFLIK